MLYTAFRRRIASLSGVRFANKFARTEISDFHFLKFTYNDTIRAPHDFEFCVRRVDLQSGSRVWIPDIRMFHFARSRRTLDDMPPVCGRLALAFAIRELF